ncbi:PREDICTED: probable serine/threonine-protein kinase clkA [Polistes canadensis]|uniref:probable serine/threonine-protein kinase clkA n=1 Tax=Polistes canadensis TaxID=91411 RepID=UPI000718AE96|nr:PREDICTED: probable serine/threonine-protein kinase clkA [Polistes canadensis]
MRRTKFYRIFVCSIIMAHASASTGNYYSKPNDRFEPSKQIFNERFMPEDSINKKNINNYNTENQERDYAFGGKINQANFEVSNLPLHSYSTNNGLPGYIDPNYENYNNNFNFAKEQLPYHFGKYSVNNSNQESDFGKYRHFDSSQFSNDHQHEGSFHTEFISGNYPAKVPLSFPPVGYEQDSDTSMIDDTYINNDNHQFYGKQRENQKIKDQIQSLNQNHGQAFDDLSSSVSNNYNSNVQGKDANFQKPERSANYRGTKYSPRNNPIPVRSHNNDNANNDYDDSESSELYNRNSKYTDSLSSNAFAAYS